MKVHDSALKHGIAPEDAVYAATWPIWTDELDEDSPARQLRLGFDTRSRLLETVVLVFDSREELIIPRDEGTPADDQSAAIATWATGRPVSVTNFTASARNSGVNLLRLSDMKTSSLHDLRSRE